MTDAERLIAVTNFDRWHRSLDREEYDHACEHRPWEKNAYVAGYDRAKREIEDIINRAYHRSKDHYFITIAEIIGVVIRDNEEEGEEYRCPFCDEPYHSGKELNIHYENRTKECSYFLNKDH